MRLPIVLGILAVATAVPAWWPASTATTTIAISAPTFDKRLGPDGAPLPPEQVGSLRVVTWDDAAKAATPIEITKKNGTWVIPSHFDFPSDGNARVSKSAAGFIGVQRGTKVADDEKRHEELGVLDPLDQKNLAKSGQGKRITIKDQTGAEIVDLVVGKNVEGASGLSYVRDIGSNEVFTAKVDGDISTKFIDYVEPDPFKLTKDDIRSVTIADYSVNEAKGAVEQRSATSFARPASDKDWNTAKTPDGKKINKTAVDNLVNEVTGLRLAGVRPYAKEWLQSRGFYVTPQGLYGNEGAVSVTTKDGLTYWMFFGEVALDDAADQKAEKAKTDAKDAKPAGANRYLAVFVRYDDKADEVAKDEAAKEAKEKEENAKKDPKDQKPPAAKAKKITGKERADKADKRFKQFFYVISDDSFKKLRPTLDQLFENKPPEPMAGKSGKTNSVWLDENGKRPGVNTTASGLQYEVLAGTGAGPSPTDADSVEVRYKGTLVDGEEFDSTKGDATATFGVTGVIKGWTEALKLMHAGDKWKVFIKPELGYGEAGSPPKIPANSILTFEMELVKIVGK